MRSLSLEEINCTFYDKISTCLITFILFSASEWKVPTTFIYGFQDWMNYQGAQEARKSMKTPCEILRVPQVPPSFLFSSDMNVSILAIDFMRLFSSNYDCRLVTLCSQTTLVVFTRPSSTRAEDSSLPNLIKNLYQKV